MSKLKPSANHVLQFSAIIVMGPSHSAIYWVSAIGPSQAGNMRLMGIDLFHTTVTNKPHTVRTRKIPICTTAQVINFSLAGATTSKEHSSASMSEHVPFSALYDGFEESHVLNLAATPDEVFPPPPLALRRVSTEVFEELHRNKHIYSAEKAFQIFTLQILERAKQPSEKVYKINSWAGHSTCLLPCSPKRGTNTKIKVRPAYCCFVNCHWQAT